MKTKLILWLALPAILLSSCVMGEEEDIVDGGDMVTNSKVDVRVTLQMPASSAPKTYAISEIDENKVEEIDVLVFNADGANWKFAYSAQAQGNSITDVSNDNDTKAKKQFTVTLIKNTAQQTFVILANAHEKLGAIGVGAEKDALLASLIYDNSGKWNANNDKSDTDPAKSFTAFPMWGEVKTTLTDATTEITGISLLRAVARLDVVLSDAVKTAGNFTLNKIYVYNSKNAGHIVPAPANMEESSAKVTAATEPTGDINNDDPLIYNVPESMNKAFERSMYLFEAAGKEEGEPTAATCVVVGGTYDTDEAPTYYRLDFFKKAETDTYYRDILRNHKYLMNIISVTGSGYATPEEAFNSKSMNMVAEVLYWNDGEGGNVVFDGQYYLSVKPKMVFNFQKDADQDVVRVKTDVPTGFQIVKITEADGTTTNSGWLSTDKTIGTSYGTDAQETAVEIRVSNNASGSARTGYIYIKAGRLEAKITVTQSTAPKRTGVFSFVEYTNVNGTGQAIPPTGGAIKATVTTNMAWTLRTDISDVEASMSEPSSETAANYNLSVDIPANATWASVDRKVWVECKGLAFEEKTFTQAGYSITTEATAVTAQAGGTSTVTITGYRPELYVRAITGEYVHDTGTVTEGTSGSGTTTLTITETTETRAITIQWSKDGTNWINITDFTQSASIAAIFARSNIVWDGSNLTFATTAAENGTIPENSQGVLFMWGSLVAISPAGDNTAFTTGHIVFSATGTTSYNWGSIPYANENSGKFANSTSTEDDFLGYDGNTNTGGRGYDEISGKGDICRYISNQPGWNKGKWRLPTADEYYKLIAEQTSVSDGTFDNIIVSPASPATNHYGYYVPTAGRWLGTGGSTGGLYFPAGGYRRSSDGTANYVGEHGYGWSGSSGGVKHCYYLAMNSNDASREPTSRQNAVPVRCVQE